MASIGLDNTEQPMDPKLMMAIEAAFRSVSLTSVEFVPVPRAWLKSNPAGGSSGPKGGRKQAIRYELAERDGIKCAYCSQEFVDIDDATLDHVIPNCVVGHWEPWNLVLACEPCNNLKANAVPAFLLPMLCHLLRTLAPVAAQARQEKRAERKAVPNAPIPTNGYPSRAAWRRAQKAAYMEAWRRKQVNEHIEAMTGRPVRLALEAAPARTAGQSEA